MSQMTDMISYMMSQLMSHHKKEVERIMASMGEVQKKQVLAHTLVTSHYRISSVTLQCMWIAFLYL